MFTGDVSAHGVYMSLANIDKSVREDISQGAWVLVAIIPKSNWHKTLAAMPKMTNDRQAALSCMLDRRLFHRCMEEVVRPFREELPHEAVDPEGNVQLMQYELAVYGADLQEQCDAECTSRNSCPHGDTKGKALGTGHCQRTKSSEVILGRINTVLANFHRIHKRYPNPLEFLDAGKKFDLNGVQRPFWQKLPAFDICKVLSPDLLHGVHKCFFDHIHKWNVNGLGAEEYDTRLKAQPETADERSFPRGVTQLKQLAGKEHRALERVHLAIVAHAPEQAEGGAGSQKLTKATRAIMDCIFLAQLPIQTERTLAAYEEAYRIFQANKDVWIENKSKRGKKGKLILGWAIPKLHLLGHVPEHVREKGTMDNYTTEIMEHLHSPTLKEPYRASNRKEWVQQVANYSSRHEIMRGYREFMEWLLETLQAEPGNGMTVDLDDPALQTIDDGDSDEDENANINRDEDEDEWYKESEEGEEDEEDEGEVGLGEVGEVGERGHERGGDPATSRNQGPEPTEPAEPTEYSRGNHQAASGVMYYSRAADSSVGQVVPGHVQTMFTAGEDNEDGDEEDESHHTLGFPVTLHPLYRVAKKPAIRAVTIDNITHSFGFPKFLQHLRNHPYFATLPFDIHAETQLDIWTMVRLTVPKSHFCPTERKCRLYSDPGLDDTKGRQRRWDSIFYLPTGSLSRRIPESEVIHVGRLALLFALKPSFEVPEPRLMAYVQRFSKIPSTPSHTSGFYGVGKLFDRGIPRTPRYEVIAASQIARPCFDLGSLYKSCNNQISDAIDIYARAAELDPGNPHITQCLNFLRNIQANGGTLPAAPGLQDTHPTAYASNGSFNPMPGNSNVGHVRSLAALSCVFRRLLFALLAPPPSMLLLFCLYPSSASPEALSASPEPSANPIHLLAAHSGAATASREVHIDGVERDHVVLRTGPAPESLVNRTERKIVGAAHAMASAVSPHGRTSDASKYGAMAAESQSLRATSPQNVVLTDSSGTIKKSLKQLYPTAPVPADYLVSLTEKYILSELGSPGKSGSFFYYSRDYRFIIKTIHHSEHKFLRRILSQYHAHISANPHTLLSRFYGLHRVKLPHGRKIHFVVMNNLFPAHLDIHETYDLKGSTVGREYDEAKARENPQARIPRSAPDTLSLLRSRVDKAFKRNGIGSDKTSTRPKLDKGLLDCFASISPKCRDEELEDLAYFVLDLYQLHGISIALSEVDVDTLVVDLRNALEEHAQKTKPRSTLVDDHHLFLVLDKNVQRIPWESLPILRGQSVSRIPSVSFLVDRVQLAGHHQGIPFVANPGDAADRVCIDPTRVRYVLNPKGDLKHTEKQLSPWLKRMTKEAGWTGIIGRKPSEAEMARSLAGADLFIYFGHGGGEQFIRSQKVRHLQRCAAAMLWGCSSGAIRDMGDFDPVGTPYHYMLAGCPTLIATLWDVTDRECDRFAQSVFTSLKLNEPRSKTSNGREGTSVVQAVASAREDGL
ncbi:hypothetical protein FRC06_001389 [Ceratobasidium sp. 370]|nr:hypothetical protein FRC06_001389 [Ceratobasidium sp. 370]